MNACRCLIKFDKTLVSVCRTAIVNQNTSVQWCSNFVIVRYNIRANASVIMLMSLAIRMPNSAKTFGVALEACQFSLF